jgi:hypothetical protein
MLRVCSAHRAPSCGTCALQSVRQQRQQLCASDRLCRGLIIDGRSGRLWGVMCVILLTVRLPLTVGMQCCRHLCVHTLAQSTPQDSVMSILDLLTVLYICGTPLVLGWCASHFWVWCVIFCLKMGTAGLNRYPACYTCAQYSSAAAAAAACMDAQVARYQYHRALVRDCSWHPYEAQLTSASWDGRIVSWGVSPPPFNARGLDGVRGDVGRFY